MRTNTSIFALAAVSLAFFVSCEKAQPEYSLESGEIAVSAVIKNITGLTVQTKADDEPYTAYTLTTPTSDTPLYAAIWATSNPGHYTGNQSKGSGTAGYVPYEANGYIDYHNTTKFTSNIRQLLDHQLFYPDADADGDIYGHRSEDADYDSTKPLKNSPVYFVGLCPRSGSWQVEGDNDNCAWTKFTGREDVMFAPEVSKNITQTNVTPSLTFNHLLTWLCIKVKAESAEAIESWGKVKKVTVESKNRISIDTQAASVAEAPTFAFASDENHYLPTYKVTDGEYTKTEFTGQSVALDTLATGQTNADLDELCYVLCAPVTASATDGATEYNLRLDIGGRKNLDVPINLIGSNKNNFSGSTAGHKFTVVLNFIVGGNISAQGRVTAWENGGLALTQLTDGEDN